MITDRILLSSILVTSQLIIFPLSCLVLMCYFCCRGIGIKTNNFYNDVEEEKKNTICGWLEVFTPLGRKLYLFGWCLCWLVVVYLYTWDSVFVINWCFF